MVSRFTKVTLEKIIVAKLIGVILLIVDYFHKALPTKSLLANILILVLVSYFLSSVIVYFYESIGKKK